MELNPLSLTLGNLELDSPLLTASGTSGSGGEIRRLAHFSAIVQALGAFVTKGVSLAPRAGNTAPRIAEVHAGMLNAIGLQNSGAAVFMERELPRLLAYERPIIVNISAGSVEEFGELAAFITEQDPHHLLDGVEINVSCPNISKGGSAFGVDAGMVERITRTVRDAVRSDMLVITKLTPNVADITEPARGAIAGGADALSLINTLRGMKIDIDTRRPVLGNGFGGLSGPAIKPVGVAMVYQCFSQIPACREGRVAIVGLGGVATVEDALEYIFAGARAVAIGTAWFADPHVFERIHRKLLAYCQKHACCLADLVGAAHRDDAN